jgi:Zn-finger nucleic acid-binding protein
MKVVRHDAGFELDRCSTCDGVWLDRGELDTLRAKVTKDWQLGPLRVPEKMDFSFSKRLQGSRGAIECPKCGATMNVTEYERWSDIVVDVCPRGHGIWLDADELRALEALFAHNEYDRDSMWATLTSAFGG